MATDTQNLSKYVLELFIVMFLHYHSVILLKQPPTATEFVIESFCGPFDLKL